MKANCCVFLNFEPWKNQSDKRLEVLPRVDFYNLARQDLTLLYKLLLTQKALQVFFFFDKNWEIKRGPNLGQDNAHNIS